MKVCVLGLGYIGLPTSVIIADSGINVVGVDIKPDLVKSINSSIPHFFEPDLNDLLSKVVSNGNFYAQLDPCEADIFIIAVPTPLNKNNTPNPVPNIDYVLKAAKSIAKKIKKNNLVILESTSPVGTTEKVNNEILCNSDLSASDFHVAYCPERVIPGRIIYELVNNDRIIGGLTNVASCLAKDFYSRFCYGDFHITNSKTAELVKLTENSFRDVNIAFANELSMVCSRLDVNELELIELANNHPRVDILTPGCGVGGHCIALDPWFIVSSAPDITKLIQAARAVNTDKASWVVGQIIKYSNEFESTHLRKPNIGILGLTYKPDVDDIRESPAFYIANELARLEINLLICEPNLREHSFFILNSLDYVIDSSDFLVCLVAHSNFQDVLNSRDTGDRPVIYDFSGKYKVNS